VSHHKPLNERLRRMVMDGLDISSLQGEDVRADLAREYLSTRRFYAKIILIIVSIICTTLVLGFLILGNQVSESTIQGCMNACQASGSYMKSVTAHTCTCEEITQGQ